MKDQIRELRIAGLNCSRWDMKGTRNPAQG